MCRTVADFLYGAKRVARLAAERFPGEPALLASGATFLETRDTEPIGRSPRRYLQRRGVVVVTDRRVFCKAPWFSPAALVYLPALVVCVYGYLSSQDNALLFASAVFLALLLQRWPFEMNIIPLESIAALRLAEVSGYSMRSDLVALGLGDHAIQVVTAQRLPDDLRRFLAHQAELARQRGAAGHL